MKLVFPSVLCTVCLKFHLALAFIWISFPWFPALSCRSVSCIFHIQCFFFLHFLILLHHMSKPCFWVPSLFSSHCLFYGMIFPLYSGHESCHCMVLSFQNLPNFLRQCLCLCSIEQCRSYACIINFWSLNFWCTFTYQSNNLILIHPCCC